MLSPSELKKTVEHISNLIGVTQAPVIGVVTRDHQLIPAIEGSSWWEEISSNPIFKQKYDFRIHVALYYPDDEVVGSRLLVVHDSASHSQLFQLRVR